MIFVKKDAIIVYYILDKIFKNKINILSEINK